MTSEERREARYQRRKAKRDEARLRRSKECGDFDEVFSFRHLYLSGKKCCKGVYWKNSTQRYIGNIIPIIAKTHRELQNGTFKHRGFHAFTIMERGKKRYIRSVHITERAVQKCLCDYCLVPTYSACFIYDNSASLKHRGMDFALRRMTCYLQRHYRRYGLEGGVLLYDFHSFFDSAPHEPLFREADRRLHDPKIRELANSFVTDFGSVGLGLGSQVSQTNALMLPNMIDHYFKEVCRIKAYERYMDDGVAISPDIDDLYLCTRMWKKHGHLPYVTYDKTVTHIQPETVKPVPTTEVKAKGVARSFNKAVAGTYTVTAGLNVRDAAGTDSRVLVTIPKGTTVKNYGYYTVVNGVKWLYVAFSHKRVNYTGFVHERFLSR